MRRQFEVNEFSWSYFDFGVVFKAYSIAEEKWLDGFVEALTGNSETISDGRVSDSLCISPADPSENDSISVASYIKIPNFCSQTDSFRITTNGSVIKVTTYHPEHIPRDASVSSCSDSVRLGRYLPGNYKLIFDSEYIDEVNTIHYSVLDTIDILISGLSGTVENKPCPVKVFPVPASQFLIVENVPAFSYYQIYSLNGQLQNKGVIENGRIKISNLKSGEYILRILNNAGSSTEKKIVVLR